MEIQNGRFDEQTAVFEESPSISGKFAEDLPDTIVIHYTAGSLLESSVTTLTNPNVKASAHLVIARDGSITQLVPFDTIAWHAGKSVWADRKGLNKYSIGIELDNAGRLTKSGEQYISWFGRTYTEEEVIKAVHRNEDDIGYWHRYTEPQITKTYEVCELLIELYHIKSILGHEEISPGRKQDPGPAFPLDKMRDKLLFADRSDLDEEIADPVNPATVTASMLNIRSGPSADAKTITNPLKKGTVVDVKDQKNGWSQVEVKINGWVASRYINSSK